MTHTNINDLVRSFLSRENTGECLGPHCHQPAPSGRKYCPDHETTAESLGFRLTR